MVKAVLHTHVDGEGERSKRRHKAVLDLFGEGLLGELQVRIMCSRLINFACTCKALQTTTFYVHCLSLFTFHCVCSAVLQVFSLVQWWWARLTLTPSHSSTPHSALYTTHCTYNTPKLTNSRRRWREGQTNYHMVCCRVNLSVLYVLATIFLPPPSRSWAESMWRDIACTVQPGGACESQTFNDYTLQMWHIIPPPLHQSRLDTVYPEPFDIIYIQSHQCSHY